MLPFDRCLKYRFLNTINVLNASLQELSHLNFVSFRDMRLLLFLPTHVIIIND